MLKSQSGIALFSLAGAIAAILMMTSFQASPAWAEDDIPAGILATEDSIPAPEDMSAETATAHEGTEEKLGFPQLDTTTYPSQIFWLFVSFAVLYTLMSKIALPRINEVLDMRQTQRTGNLNRAQQLNEEAEKVQTAYEASLAKAQTEAQEILSKSEQALNDKATAENAGFMENARKRISIAEQNIAKAREEALNSLADISAEVAVEMVARIADVQISKADAKKVVLTEMQKG